MRIILPILSAVFLLNMIVTADLSAGDRLPLSLGGYIKEMPSLQLDNNFENPSLGNLVHNRLNFRWDITTNADLRVESRNRLIYNEMLGDFPRYEDLLGQDDGLIDMSWVWLSDNSLFGHTMIDRFYLSWRTDNWRIRTGRQRVNWGINLVSNPNDLFNVYSFFDFDYPERPGTDAIRIQHYIDGMSSLELAVSPSDNGKETVAATRMNYNYMGYDLQAIAGYYRNRLALGAGWAGNLKEAGLKGEISWFYDLEKTEGVERGNFVAAAGMDYMFPGGTFGIVEFLYNGGYARDPETAFMITQPLRADNIMFSEFAVTVSAEHSFSPVLKGGLSFMALPDIDAAFVMPNLDYSLARNFDMELVGQIFAGGERTIFEQAGHSLFLSVQYSF